MNPTWSINRGSSSTLPVTLQEAKDFCYEDRSTQDAEFTNFIRTATAEVERRSKHQLITGSHTLYLNGFWGATRIKLPWPPLVSISSISYVDTAGDTQTWSSSLWVFEKNRKFSYFMPAYNEQWPQTRQQRDAVSVSFSSGYGTTAAILAADKNAAAYRQAILTMVKMFDDQRSPIVTGAMVNEIKPILGDLLRPIPFGDPWVWEA